MIDRERVQDDIRGKPKLLQFFVIVFDYTVSAVFVANKATGAWPEIFTGKIEPRYLNGETYPIKSFKRIFQVNGAIAVFPWAAADGK